MDVIVRNTTAKLTATFADGDTPLTATGDVTVTVIDGSGTQVATGTATAQPDGSYAYTLAPQANLGTLTATWSGMFEGYEQTQAQSVEVVGGQLLTLAECRAADKVLADTTKYPAADVLEALAQVQDEFERVVNFSLVPRAGYVELDGVNRPWLTLPDVYLSKVSAVTIVTGTNVWEGDAAPGETDTVWTAAQVNDLTVRYTGRIERRDGTVFPVGAGNVKVSYEHGMAVVPDDLKRAAKLRLANLLVSKSSGIPDRATSFVAAEGGQFTLSTAGRGLNSFTGIPQVDAVLARYVVPRGIA